MTDSSQQPMNPASTPTQEPSPKKTRSPEYNAILALGALILALAGIFSTQTYWIRADLNAAQARTDAIRLEIQTQAAADRRQFHTRADAIRRDFNDRTDAIRLEIKKQADADRLEFNTRANAIRRDFNDRTDAIRLEVKTQADADRAKADADRRAFQTAMDAFRNQILQLTDRQARIEAIQEPIASGASTDS